MGRRERGHPRVFRAEPERVAMERNLSRREFVAACISASFIGVLSIAWDSAVNGGRPASAKTEESPNGDGEEPP